MRILVTGATGVLGRRVLPLLVDAGHTVGAVARGRAGQVRRAGAEPLALDLFDPPAVKQAVAGHDAVVDLATSIPPTWRMGLRSAWTTNDRLRRDASRNLSRALLATGGERYVRESFLLVYADGGEAWLDEQAPVDPPPVVETALDAEASARRVTEQGGVGVALRFAQFYGPDAGHIRDLLRAARLGIAAFPGDPAGFDARVHLDDAARAVVAALDAPAGVYNVADDEPLRRSQHAAALGAALDRRLRLPPRWLTRLGPLAQLDRSVRLDATRLREATGWAPRIPSVREGWPRVLEALHALHA